jgi:hypothetical protein
VWWLVIMAEAASAEDTLVAEDMLVAAGTSGVGEERVAVGGIAAVEVVVAPVLAEAVVGVTEQIQWQVSRWELLGR